MCKFFLQGNCQFGAHCRNAHSQEEVNAALAAESGVSLFFSYTMI